jgi:formate dehydrogenase iron-sulfur subunit
MSERPAELLQTLLADQHRLQTPAAEFSRLHEEGLEPLQARYYKSLLPLSKPAAGEQYAFEVNLDACTGCKACVVACHSLNGLDESESWRDTGALAGPGYLQTVTTACHHCADPACANGCPTLAYEKDATTGIVRHLDDQCMGCSYCILKCPYDVPKYNVKRGIVRKCDMCQSRLAEGEAPACVQACPSEAITIRTVTRDDIAARSATGTLLPGTFPSAYTQPSTRYVSSRPVPETARGIEELREDHAHTPLVAMLVLTQMAAGAFFFAAPAGDVRLGALAAVILFAGLGAAVLHLGRPSKAWKSFLGWRKSWLSREIIAFNAMAGLATGVLAAAFLPVPAALSAPLLWGAAAMGAVAVFTSIMVYVDTRRPFWSAGMTTGKFAGTTLLLGCCAAALMWAWSGHTGGRAMMMTSVTLRVGLTAWEWTMNRAALADVNSPWHRSALIMARLQGRWRRIRFGLFLITVLLAPGVALLFPAAAPYILTLALPAVVASQSIERHQFFTAAAAPVMPGCRST